MRFVAAAGGKMSVQYHLNFHVRGISCLPLKKGPLSLWQHAFIRLPHSLATTPLRVSLYYHFFSLQVSRHAYGLLFVAGFH
jgi:hypothetical protein